MYKTLNGRTINFNNSKELAAGGEGRILQHPMNINEVLKIYHTVRPKAYKSHLQSLGTLPKSFVTPKDIILDSNDSVAGYIMDYVNFNNYTLFNNLFNKGFCTTNNITDKFKLDVLDDLKINLEELHKQNIQVGDLNQYNMYFSKTGKMLFVDVDSYQTPSNPHSGVLLEDIRDWTTSTINNLSDSWSFDILVFWALTYCHPFKWVAPGNGETLEIRVKTGNSFLSNPAGIKIPKIYKPVPTDLETQFKSIFKGQRFMVDLSGTPVVHANVQIRQQVQSQNVNIREIDTDVYEVHASLDRVSYRTRVSEWTLISTALKGMTAIKEERSLFEIYPGNKTVLYRSGDTLYNENKIEIGNYTQPIFYFNSGSLSVLDYANDKQYNYDIDAQMSNTVSYTITEVYAKSVLYGNSPVQNFGAKKRLNVPVKSSYRLIDVPAGTKTAYYSNGYFACEMIVRNAVEYRIQSTTNSKILAYDYLPQFAAFGNMLFVPTDSGIDVYRDMVLAVTLDVPVSTRDSKLFYTTAGILLLENNILYLLNTK